MKHTISIFNVLAACLMFFTFSCDQPTDPAPIDTHPTPTPAAQAPGFIRAQPLDAKVKLTWDTAAVNNTYTIYYATGTTVSKSDQKIAGVKPPYVLSSLANDTKYSFAISAVNAAGESGLGKAISATPWRSTQSTAGMKLLIGGTFTMGSPDSLYLVYPNDAFPAHQVTLSSFYIDTTEVTQALYASLMGTNPSRSNGCLADQWRTLDFGNEPQRPVERTCWYDAVLFCNARSRSDGFDSVYSYSSIQTVINPIIFGSEAYGDTFKVLIGVQADFSKNGYRLPTEAEFEYALRGGTTTICYWGTDTSMATAALYEWHVVTNLTGETHAVAQKRPNRFGLYDMLGNVAEWCSDWDGPYTHADQTNPAGPLSGASRVFRGFGGNCSGGAFCSSVTMRNRAPILANQFGIGFRCVRK